MPDDANPAEPMATHGAALFRQERRGRARHLAEAMRPYAEAAPGLRVHVEAIRRFGAGEFVPRGELVVASAVIRVALEFIHLAEQGRLTRQR